MNVTLTDEQFKELLAAIQPKPDPEVEAKRAAKVAEELENRRVAADRAKQEDEQKAAVRAKCNHAQGSAMESDKRTGKSYLTQGRSADSALVLNKGSKFPASLEDSFIVCQHCQTVILPTSPEWDAAFEVAA